MENMDAKGNDRKHYRGIEKQTDNPFLNLYHIDALGRDGTPFHYYFASRNDENNIKHKTHSMRPEGMAVYAVTEDGEKLVLVRQYRYPVNDYLYELPAGLIEPEETASEAACREMIEETGWKLEVYEGGEPAFRRGFFLAQGLTDESGSMIFSVQAGNVRMYAVALFFLTLTGLSAYDIFREPARKKWIVFCIASIGTVYCHTFALIQTFLFYLLFFAVILICHKKELIKGYFISGFTVALVFSPWLAVTIRQFVLRMRYDDGSTAELATLYSVMDYCKEWFSAVETPIGIVVLLGMALCLVLSYGAVDWVRQNHNIAPAIAFGTFALTGIVGGVISATVNNCFMGRYAFPGMGFVMLWYAVGFAQITENTKGKSRKIWAAGLLGTAGLCFLLQYTSEIRLEYNDGLETYENFVEEYMTENDAIIGPYTHTIFLNVYHPELHYYTIAYKLYSLPFVNTEALSSYSQLDTYDNLWYICFQGGYPNEMEDEYSYEQVLEFHYMYYDFAIFRLEKLEEE